MIKNALNLWRLIESPPSDISSQMALDRELFEDFIQNLEAPPLLRIYRVTERAVTVGRSYRGAVTASARQHQPGTPSNGSCVCVRPTGGGLVEHGKDLLYSVIGRRDTFPTFNLVRTSYLSFHEAIQEAFKKLGIETRLFRCDEARLDRHCHPWHWRSRCEATFQTRPKQSSRLLRRPNGLLAMTDCFSHPVATDVLANEQKIAGGAQWRRGRAFLHQGSVLIPQGISYERLKEAVIDAFEKKFDLVWSKMVGVT